MKIKSGTTVLTGIQNGPGLMNECVKACRHHDIENGQWWTGAPFPEFTFYTPKEGEISESYFGPDFSLWNCQQERDKSLTLSTVSQCEGGSGLEGLDEIVGLE